jgi:inorganic pyrophosphatase
MARDSRRKRKAIPVLIEAPQGARSKLSYDFALGVLTLTKVLPAGFEFPFNFGSIPCTLADDGDPLDVLLFMTDRVPAGSLVAARPVGVLEAEQSENGKETERNDRIVAVALDSSEHRRLTSALAIDPETRREFEHFFVAYNAPKKRFEPLGWHGPGSAWSLIERARRRYRPERPRKKPLSFADYLEAASGD